MDENFLIGILNKSIESSTAIVMHVNGMNPITTRIIGFDEEFVQFVLPEGKGQLKAIIRRDDVRIVVDLNKSFDNFLKEVEAAEAERRAHIENAMNSSSKANDQNDHVEEVQSNEQQPK